jgi:glycosyltransferase involved in cell wall biosynthesis
MLRVGIDTLFLDGRTRSSLANFVIELTNELVASAEGEAYVVFVSPLTEKLFAHLADRVELVRCAVGNDRVFRRILFQQLALPVLIRRHHIDVMCCLADVAPVAATAPIVLKVNTLHHYLTPSALGRARSAYRRVMVKASVLKARLVIANSRSTVEAIERLLRVPGPRLRLVYEAVDDVFAPPDDRTALALRLAQRYGLSGPYLLFVSVLYPYKNLDVLIRAFATLTESGGWKGALVVAGSDPFGTRPASEALAGALNLRDRVVFLGHVPQADLCDLYGGATAFVYPSASETFGKPILEAMRCGTPVVASTAGAIPEIADGAALLFQPSDSNELAARLSEIIRDSALRSRLQEAGFKRSGDFTWAAVAQGFRAAIQDAATVSG